MSFHKYTFFLALFSWLSYGQNTLTTTDFKQATPMFENCLGLEDSNDCFDAAISSSIILNAGEEISSYLNTVDNLENKSIYVSFIISEEGKAIEESIRASGYKDTALKEQLIYAIKELPEILPVRNEYNHEILYYYSLYLYFERTESGLIMISEKHHEPKERKDAKISTSSFTPPIYPGCDSYDSFELSRKCMSNKVSKLISNKIKINKATKGFKKRGTFNTFILFEIDTNGRANNVKAYGPTRNFEEASKKALLKIKKVKPGTKNGKPVVVPYTLPIKFKLSD